MARRAPKKNKPPSAQFTSSKTPLPGYCRLSRLRGPHRAQMPVPSRPPGPSRSAFHLCLPPSRRPVLGPRRLSCHCPGQPPPRPPLPLSRSYLPRPSSPQKPQLPSPSPSRRAMGTPGLLFRLPPRPRPPLNELSLPLTHTHTSSSPQKHAGVRKKKLEKKTQKCPSGKDKCICGWSI